MQGDSDLFHDLLRFYLLVFNSSTRIIAHLVSSILFFLSFLSGRGIALQLYTYGSRSRM